MSNADDHGDDGLDELGDDGEPPTPEVIEDPDSYVQTRRLKDIFNARRDVRKQRLKMKTVAIDADNPGDVTAAKRGYRAAVETYLQEIRPLFLNDERGQEVWFGLDFGTLKIHLPVQRETAGLDQSQLVHTTQQPNGEITKHTINDRPEPKEIDLYGLNYLFDLPEPVVAEFDITTTSSGEWGKSVRGDTVTKQHDIGFDRLDEIVNEANHRLEQRGLDLELGEDNAVAEADYSDIA